MTVTDYTITKPTQPQRSVQGSVFIDDLASFDAATSGTNAVAALYFFHQLDCLVQLAHRVADDFAARPHVYVAVDQAESSSGDHTISRTLARLQGRFGYHEDFPSDEQRTRIFTALFGCGIDLSAPESGEFPALRDAVLTAAAAFAETGVDSGIDMLRGGFRTAAANLNDYLAEVIGDSARTSREQLAVLTECASYPVLRSPGVAHAFGVTQAPKPNWPYTPDANADKLVALASKTLDGAATVTSDRSSVLNRTGLRGAEALAMIMNGAQLFDSSDSQSDPQVDDIINKCYTWRAALSRGPGSWAGMAR